MPESDVAYCKRRAREERRMSARAAKPRRAAIHAEMAERFVTGYWKGTALGSPSVMAVMKSRRLSGYLPLGRFSHSPPWSHAAVPIQGTVSLARVSPRGSHENCKHRFCICSGNRAGDDYLRLSALP